MRFMIMRKADRDTSADARVTFCDGKPTVAHGPFPETTQLMAGFTMIDAGSREEAIDWVTRGVAAEDAEVEIREVGCPGGLVGFIPSIPAGRPGPDPQFLILLKANAILESGVAPDEARLAAMAQRNEESIKAGVMLAGEGLQPSSKGARVKVSAGRAAVTDGPFTEAKELIAGFWLIQVKSKEEAIEWVKRYPYPLSDVEVEVRLITEGAPHD
jgi:hypothetical protein